MGDRETELVRFDERPRKRRQRARKLRIQPPFWSGGERLKCLDEAIRCDQKPIVHDAAIVPDHDQPGIPPERYAVSRGTSGVGDQ